MTPHVPSGAISTPSRPRWLVGVAAVLLLGVAAVYAYYIMFSRPLSLDEGYLMITVRSFNEGQPLYDSVFTQYGPLYYFYEYILHGWLAVPLTQDATRLVGIVHWLAAAALLGVTGGTLMRSAFGGLFVFAQAMAHLTRLADEPGHPQELVVVLFGIALVLVARAERRSELLMFLAGLAALLAFTKINVGIFFGFALLLAIACHSDDRFTRGAGKWALLLVCAAVPFLLMRRHLAAEWCRNFSIVVAGATISSLLVASRFATPQQPRPDRLFKVAVPFVVVAAVLTGLALASGTTLNGLINGLLVVPLKMPDVALLPLPLSNLVLLNVGASLAFGVMVVVRQPDRRAHNVVNVLKALYGIVGAFLLIGNAAAQLAWLLPWTWLVLVPPQSGNQTFLEHNFARVFLGLAAVWQSLQAYPIAGTQMTVATTLLVVSYAVCLSDALPAAQTSFHLRERLTARFTPRQLKFASALPFIVLLGLFADVWCKLPAARREFARLPLLDLPGSRRVRVDAELAGMYRELADYLRAECDTFVTYPGINSLYFWSDKQPPTHLNSTGWGQLSHVQQEHILGAWQKAKRPMLVVVADRADAWASYAPPQLAPLIRCVREDCREVKRIGRFILFAPKTPGELTRRD